MKITELKEICSDQGNGVLHTTSIAVAERALDSGLHVQGMNGVKGYSAYIFTNEKATKSSFISK